MGDFIKLSGSTKTHLMTQKLTNMWQHVRVDYITADNAQERVKLGRLLDVGKTADLDGTALLALGKKTNGCIDHRLDKLFIFLAQHPECEDLPMVFPSGVLAIPASAAPERLFSTSGDTMTKKRCSLSCDHLEECVYLHGPGLKSGSGRLTRRFTTCISQSRLDFFLDL